MNFAPLLVEVEKPMSDAPPLWNRPTWKVETMVDPNEKVSGSTCVRWKLVEFVNGSELICVNPVWAASTVPDNATTSPAAKATTGTSLFISIPLSPISRAYGIATVATTCCWKWLGLLPSSNVLTEVV